MKSFLRLRNYLMSPWSTSNLELFCPRDSKRKINFKDRKVKLMVMVP